MTKLRATVANVRKAGFALLDQELEVGLRSIAVPVKKARGEVVAAINIAAHSSRVSLSAMQTKFLPTLRRVAEALGGALLG